MTTPLTSGRSVASGGAVVASEKEGEQLWRICYGAEFPGRADRVEAAVAMKVRTGGAPQGLPACPVSQSAGSPPTSAVTPLTPRRGRRPACGSPPGPERRSCSPGPRQLRDAILQRAGEGRGRAPRARPGWARCASSFPRLCRARPLTLGESLNSPRCREHHGIHGDRSTLGGQAPIWGGRTGSGRGGRGSTPRGPEG